MSFPQMQQDAPVLKYPEDFAPHPNISLETAANMLLRAIQTSQNLPYHWTYIDKPQGTNSVETSNHGLTYKLYAMQKAKYTFCSCQIPVSL
jgi:hypothetical protein